MTKLHTEIKKRETQLETLTRGKGKQQLELQAALGTIVTLEEKAKVQPRAINLLPLCVIACVECQNIVSSLYCARLLMSECRPTSKPLRRMNPR